VGPFIFQRITTRDAVVRGLISDGSNVLRLFCKMRRYHRQQDSGDSTTSNKAVYFWDALENPALPATEIRVLLLGHSSSRRQTVGLLVAQVGPTSTTGTYRRLGLSVSHDEDKWQDVEEAQEVLLV
jgi:hypothetical protein